ncbi:MAG: endonuclease/exonuclease/phosphatase family protein [Kiloniellales bacterium]
MRHGSVSVSLAKSLIELRKRIEAAKIPPSKLDETLNFATWNIREFGRKKRKARAIHYIAEILSQFDLIAITEVRSNLEDLLRAMYIMGPYWDMVFSDFDTDPAGNQERIAYVFDKRMVRFTGLAAEAGPPRRKDKKSGEYLPAYTWWRSPYMASFRAGNFDFVVLAVHIRWAGGEKDRLVALKGLADWVDKRRKHKFAVDKDIIVVGDMNIPSRRSESYKIITNNGKGLRLPRGLENIEEKQATTNLSRTATYDQILHYPTHAERFTNNGGVLDFYQGDIKPLFPDDPDLWQGDKHTYQMSDHLPLWVQIDTWIEDHQLDSCLAGR